MQALPLPLERAGEVLQVLQHLFLRDPHRSRQLLERTWTIAKSLVEPLAHGLVSRCRWTRTRASAIVASAVHEPSLRAATRVRNHPRSH